MTTRELWQKNDWMKKRSPPAGLNRQDFQIPYDLFESYILPAVKSIDPLPANPASTARLEALRKNVP
jgi:hypothetical protein